MVCMAAVCAPMCETTGSFSFKNPSYLGGGGGGKTEFLSQGLLV